MVAVVDAKYDKVWSEDIMISENLSMPTTTH